VIEHYRFSKVIEIDRIFQSDRFVTGVNLRKPCKVIENFRIFSDFCGNGQKIAGFVVVLPAL